MMAVGAHQIPTWRQLLRNRLRRFRIDMHKGDPLPHAPPARAPPRHKQAQALRALDKPAPRTAEERKQACKRTIPGAHLATW